MFWSKFIAVAAGCLSLVILKTFQGLLIEVCVLSMAFNSPFRDFDAGMQRQPVLQVLSNYDFLLKKYVYISYTDVEASLKQSRATNMWRDWCRPLCKNIFRLGEEKKRNTHTYRGSKFRYAMIPVLLSSTHQWRGEIGPVFTPSNPVQNEYNGVQMLFILWSPSSSG